MKGSSSIDLTWKSHKWQKQYWSCEDLIIQACPHSWCIQKSAAHINLSIQLCLVSEIATEHSFKIVNQAPGAARISWELTELAATVIIRNVLILVEEDSFGSWSMTSSSSVPSKRRLETWALTWIVHHHKYCRWWTAGNIQSWTGITYFNTTWANIVRIFLFLIQVGNGCLRIYIFWIPFGSVLYNIHIPSYLGKITLVSRWY